MASIIGLPLGVGLLAALVVVFPLGYVVMSLILGRLIARRVRDVWAFVIGFAILRAAAIIPGLGWIIGFLAAAFGVGALIVAAWRAGRPAAAASSSDPAAPPPPPGDAPGPPPAPEAPTQPAVSEA
jgi:hypothetical protein